MRKGIVMEQKRNYTIIMTNDGHFHQAKLLKHAEIGMEVHFEGIHENRKQIQWATFGKQNYTKIAIVALAILLALFPVYSWYDSNQVYAYVNLDINPSVEMELNEDMQVIDIHPQNEQAEIIVSLLKDWRKDNASEVTLKLIELSKEKGYVNEKNQVLIGVSYTQSEASDVFSDRIESFLTDQALNMSVAAFFVPQKIRQKAEEANTSVNSLIAENIKKMNEEEQPLRLTVEDDDKEIILSYYKKDSSSGEGIDQTIRLQDPVIEKKAVPSVEKQQGKQKTATEEKRGNETAPGQLKKQEKSKEKQKKHASNQKNHPSTDGKNKEKNNNHPHKEKPKKQDHQKGVKKSKDNKPHPHKKGEKSKKHKKNDHPHKGKHKH